MSRPATERERAVLVAPYGKELARYRTSPADAAAIASGGEAPRMDSKADAADLAATIRVARAVLNIHEMIPRN